MQLTIIAAAIAAFLTFTTTWKIQEWRYEAKDKARIEAAAEAQKMREKVVSSASTSFEKKREAVRVKTIIITKTVDKFFDRPVYKNICIDEDGLKAINESLAK